MVKSKNQLKKKKQIRAFSAEEDRSVGEKKQKNYSQLRQDLITGDWVVIATNRSKRPEDFQKKKTGVELSSNQENCPFCWPEKTGQEKDVLIYRVGEDDWTLRVFPNKFPAFSPPKGRLVHQTEGPYFWMEGLGYHEVIVTRDHQKSIGQMEDWQVAEIIDAFQTRYLDLMNKKAVRYIEIFHNHGQEAGASIAHPHSQLAAVPVISPYLQNEISGAEDYHSRNKRCVYCEMSDWEKQKKLRLVWENEKFLIFCPFASRAAFEMWIIPQKHSPYFERITDEEKFFLGAALKEALARVGRLLDDPAYNFYLHTAPCDGKDYPHFHWHIEILPKTSLWAGFELSTGIEISTILPETAAEYLRKA